MGAPFGVVGVNGGLANNANPCLAVELAWAAATRGLLSPPQPALSLYLNTADPGPSVADWPPQALATVGGGTPYGGCDGSWTPACAYVYGAGRAATGYALAAGAGAAAATVPWWLDIETVSSWARPEGLAAWAAVNVAAIQGFVAGLRGAGAGGPIGFYSTAFQWQALTGLDAATSPGRVGAGAPDWVAGTGSLAEAQAHCQASFSGGPVRLAQYAVAGLDGDLACSTPVDPRLRILDAARRGHALRVVGTVSPAYRGRLVVTLTGSGRARLRRHPLVLGGRWQVKVTVGGGGLLVVQSAPAYGLRAGLARARVR